MKIIYTAIVSVLCFTNSLYAQTSNYESIDKITLEIPDSLTTSVQNIVNYIDSNFLTNDLKLRAAYIWITENISYDIANMYSFKKDTNSVNTTLLTRKGVCYNYAELFNSIANNLGIKSHIVLGYTKGNGVINYNPHKWCVAIIDSNWFMFDPTWGAGIIHNSKYIKNFDDRYFKMDPANAINSHMPFDPLWQFVQHPITNTEFCNDSIVMENEEECFRFYDTLLAYESQSKIEQLIAVKKGIESNDINSYLIYTTIQQLNSEIENYYYNKVINQYSSALNLYKKGIFSLNRFIDYRNNHFSPNNSDLKIKQMLDSIEVSFNQTIYHLNSIENPNARIKSSIDNLHKSTEAAILNLNDHKVFVKKYINTNKNYRKSLFYDKL